MSSPGDDSLSKVGTKHAALLSSPVGLLFQFGETDAFSVADLELAERYLVDVWVGARSKTSSSTFDHLRLEVHINSVAGLDELPPTSSVIKGHISRIFLVIRNALTLLTAGKHWIL